MFRSSNNISSRSTQFGSNSSSRRRRRRRLKKPYEKPLLSEIQILSKKTVKDIIEHAIQIADFHIRHKKYQRT